MTPADYTSVAIAERIPVASTHDFINPVYIGQPEERAKCVEEEGTRVEELRELTRRYQREYKRITIEICRPRTRFNAMAYVSRLPTEILSLIFEAYVADHWESYFPLYPLDFPSKGLKNADVTPYQWIKNVLHVCRQWRHVALSTPQLWTTIAHDRIYEPWRLDFLLEHAGSFQLTLRNDFHISKATKKPDSEDDSEDDSEGGLEDLHSHDSSGLAIFRQTLQNFVQLQTLALIVTPEMEEILTTLTRDVDAPLMKHLDLDLTGGRDALKYSPLFLNVNMPRLKSLTLWKGPSELMQRLSCPSLTRLDVSLCDHISVGKLLDVLENTPGLQQLVIDHVVPDEGDIPQRTVQLLSLDKLWFDGLILIAGQLLHQLVFPTDTLIELCADDGFPAPFLSQVMPGLLGHTTSSSDPGRTNLMRPVGPHTLRVMAYDGDDDYITTSMWFSGLPAPPTHQCSQDDDHNTSGSRSTLDPVWRQDRPRLNLVCPRKRFQLDMLDTMDLVSLELGEGAFERLNEWEEMTAILRRPAFLKLETLCIDFPWSIDLVLEELVALAESALPPVEASVDGCSSVPAPCTYLRLPSLKTLILHDPIYQLSKFKEGDENWTFRLLRRCAQLEYRLKLLRITYLSRSATDIFQDAVYKLGIADVVEINTTIEY